ncbi:hypothetical protein [Bordetella trematum]|nr:hypothetical protein [Bordetella trematum]
MDSSHMDMAGAKAGAQKKRIRMTTAPGGTGIKDQRIKAEGEHGLPRRA